MTNYMLTKTDLHNAVEQLKRSRRGQTAMRKLLEWLDDTGLGLDEQNQDAVLILMEGAWGPFPSTARDLMREATRKTPRRQSSHAWLDDTGLGDDAS